MECLGFLSLSGVANLQRFKSKRRITSKIFAVNQTGLLASKYVKPPARDSQDAALSNHSHSHLLLCHLEQGIVTEKNSPVKIETGSSNMIWRFLRLGGNNTDTHADARDQIV